MVNIPVDIYFSSNWSSKNQLCYFPLNIETLIILSLHCIYNHRSDYKYKEQVELINFMGQLRMSKDWVTEVELLENTK